MALALTVPQRTGRVVGTDLEQVDASGDLRMSVVESTGQPVRWGP